MNGKPTFFDFVYAVRNTKIVCAPDKLLNAFDQTTIDYTLLARPMDDPYKTRIREGKLQTFPPRLLLPDALTTQELEGFGKEAYKYLEFLKKHASRIRILRYSYRLRCESYSETLLSDPLETVQERVKDAFKERANPYAALVTGVDEPWDVCLFHLFARLVQASVPRTLHAFEQRAKENFRESMPQTVREEIERAFAAAEKDPSNIKPLGRLLKEKGLFDVYQDRFFALLP